MRRLKAFETFCLTADEFGIVEIVDAHCLTHFCHGLRRCFAGFLRALAQDVVNLGNVLLKLVAALAHRLEHVVEDGVEKFLAGAVADASVDIVFLEVVEILELRPIVGEVVVGAEGLKVCEHGVSLKVSRLVHRHSRCSV